MSIRSHAIADALENATRRAAADAREGRSVEPLACLAVSSRDIISDSEAVASHLEAISRDIGAVREMHLFGKHAGDIIDRAQRNADTAACLARSVERAVTIIYLLPEIEGGIDTASQATRYAVCDLLRRAQNHRDDVSDASDRLRTETACLVAKLGAGAEKKY